MSQVFYGAWLARRGDLGWATHEAHFPARQILAHIQLSALSLADGERFQSFRRRYALAYIETELTPPGPFGIPMPNKETDNHVWLETDQVTFQLQADGVETASALGLIHDLSPQADSPAKVVETRDFVVHDDQGSVLGSHRVVRLDGARELDLDGIRQRVLDRAAGLVTRPVDIVSVDLTGIPPRLAFRVDPRTHRPVPLPD